MLLFTQPIPPSAKAHLESQFALFSDLSNQLFTTAQRINELNIQVTQRIVEESLDNMQQVMAAQNPYEALSIAAGQVQPNAEKLRAYQQHLTNIAATTQMELAKTAEAHVPETTRTASAVADEVARRATEETQKAAQRQKEAMEKVTNPIIKPSEGKAATQNVH